MSNIRVHNYFTDRPSLLHFHTAPPRQLLYISDQTNTVESTAPTTWPFMWQCMCKTPWTRSELAKVDNKEFKCIKMQYLVHPNQRCFFSVFMYLSLQVTRPDQGDLTLQIIKPKFSNSSVAKTLAFKSSKSLENCGHKLTKLSTNSNPKTRWSSVTPNSARRLQFWEFVFSVVSLIFFLFLQHFQSLLKVTRCRKLQCGPQTLFKNAALDVIHGPENTDNGLTFPSRKTKVSTLIRNRRWLCAVGIQSSSIFQSMKRRRCCK